MKKRTVAVLCAVAAVLGVIIGGTMAYLQHGASVVNTFTAGNITIALSETKDGELVKARDDYVLVPGAELNKDPRVAVKQGSESCYLFVEVTEANWKDEPVQYTIADGWTPVPNSKNVYYREFNKSEPGVELMKNADKDEKGNSFDGYLYPILALATEEGKISNVVKVSENLTKSEMEAYGKKPADFPQLTFQAYAIQRDWLTNNYDEAIEDIATIWALVKDVKPSAKA